MPVSERRTHGQQQRPGLPTKRGSTAHSTALARTHQHVHRLHLRHSVDIVLGRAIRQHDAVSASAAGKGVLLR